MKLIKPHMLPWFQTIRYLTLSKPQHNLNTRVVHISTIKNQMIKHAIKMNFNLIHLLNKILLTCNSRVKIKYSTTWIIPNVMALKGHEVVKQLYSIKGLLHLLEILLMDLLKRNFKMNSRLILLRMLYLRNKDHR